MSCDKPRTAGFADGGALGKQSTRQKKGRHVVAVKLVDLSTWASVGKQWQEIWWRRLRSRALHSGVVRRGQLSNSDGESVLREVSRYQRTQPSLKTTFVPFVLEQYTRNSQRMERARCC